MSGLHDAWDRLRYGKSLQKQLKDSLEGSEWSIPIIEWEHRKELEQRGDYRDLMAEFYGSPDAVKPPVPHEEFNYTITGVEVRESRSDIYRLKRIFNRTDFEARVHIELSAEEAAFLNFNPYKEPLYEELSLRMETRDAKSGLKLYHEWEGWETFATNIAGFNQLLSKDFSRPETIDGMVEEISKIKAYNEFSEHFR